MTISDNIDSAVIENLSQRVAEQQAEIESLTAKLGEGEDKLLCDALTAQTAAEAKLSTIREECAKVAESFYDNGLLTGDPKPYRPIQAKIADAIRSLSTKGERDD
jgi:uncharacterized coiled-coil protein SlyX